MIKILLVEDDREIAQNIEEYLKDFAQITIIHDGLEGIFEAKSQIYDCIVLDWMLPEKSGIEILQEIRANHQITPVLMLTAKDDIEDRIKGFQYGADDYLTKPFYLEELKMRLTVLLKRSGRLQGENTLTYADVRIFLDNQTVMHEEKELDILGKEFDLLVYLLQNQGVILTKEQIFDRIWGFDSETALNVVEVYMSKLRKNLKGTALEGCIQTLRNVGYLLKKEA